MTDEEPSSPPALSSCELIVSINHNDVLMGRGSGPYEFVGNQQFRSIVEQRKEDFKVACFKQGKKKIATDVLDCIDALEEDF